MKLWHSICFLLLVSCVSQKERIINIWTPELTNAVIADAKNSGCFDKKVIIKEGKEHSCYIAAMYFKDTAWKTTCEPICRQEVPECYEDGWVLPFSKRCEQIEEYYKGK